jgi:hypothetical protein
LPFEDYDTADLHSTTDNASRLTAPVTGVYRISANVSWEPSPGFKDLLLVSHATSGDSTILAEDQNDAGDRQPVSVSTDYKLSAGDYVDVLVTQDSGIVGPGASTLRSSLAMSWVAPG